MDVDDEDGLSIVDLERDIVARRVFCVEMAPLTYNEEKAETGRE